MEANGSQEEPRHLSSDHESLNKDPKKRKGGWITFPFLAVAMLCLGLATAGAMSNVVVYLTQEYHVASVDAAQISTIIAGSISVAPVAGAIVADAFFGCYPIVAIAMATSVLSLVVFTLTANLPGLRPAPCQLGAGPCEQASTGQMAALYAGVFLLCLSAAGASSNQATMGANQFEAAADRDVFFNWYFILLYASSVLGATVIVYVQDTVSWTLGFGISCAASVVGLAALLLGARYYRKPTAQGSPFTGLARVVVAAARKRKVGAVGSEELKFYYGIRSGDEDGKTGGDGVVPPSDSFSFLYPWWEENFSTNPGGTAAASQARFRPNKRALAVPPRAPAVTPPTIPPRDPDARVVEAEAQSREQDCAGGGGPRPTAA